ncbi:hypothetical protein Taro_022551 [Colocasia esculenta]|uniref:WRKY domain-containing protein n=1 Tax=Colocasia esculenta TaxID=4460 RepID=A0A843V1V9_COLES|nr:hypothetical protein [Colocasia esculenta]
MARGHQGLQLAIPSFLQEANEEALQSPGWDPLAKAGAGSEDHPSLTVSDYISIFDEESPPEGYYSALLAGADPVGQPSPTVSDYIPIFHEDYSQPEDYYSASLVAATGQYCYQELFLPAEDTGESSMVGPTSSGLECNDGVQAERNMDERNKYVFRTQSEKDVLEDGYRWRKYGKKSVKNSPNKRNYYRCTAEGCNVKKRIERDREDHSYVLTTYEGKHCHPPPGDRYYPVAPGASSSASAACAQWDSPSRPVTTMVFGAESYGRP